jgi:hypothetical protein
VLVPTDTQAACIPGKAAGWCCWRPTKYCCIGSVAVARDDAIDIPTCTAGQAVCCSCLGSASADHHCVPCTPHAVMWLMPATHPARNHPPGHQMHPRHCTSTWERLHWGQVRCWDRRLPCILLLSAYHHRRMGPPRCCFQGRVEAQRQSNLQHMQHQHMAYTTCIVLKSTM